MKRWERTVAEEVERFCREEIEPLDMVFPYAVRSKDPKVKAILVNIFGGILRCTTLADGIVAAAKAINLSVPLVVRLEGTEVEQGRKILGESGVNLITATDMTDAATKVVAAAKGVS